MLSTSRLFVVKAAVALFTVTLCAWFLRAQQANMKQPGLRCTSRPRPSRSGSGSSLSGFSSTIRAPRSGS